MARWLGIFFLVLCLSGSGWGYDHSEGIEIRGLQELYRLRFICHLPSYTRKSL